MDLSIVIPWTSGTSERERIKDAVVDRWNLILPGAQIILFGTDPFVRAASCNGGVERADNNHILIADADTITNSQYIFDGINMLNNGAPWVIPYGSKDYYNGTREQAKDLAWIQEQVIHRPYDYDFKLLSWSGMVLCRKSDYQRVQFDERFKGWGWEDVAFMLSMNNVVGSYERCDGFVYHIWHERGPSQFGTQAEIASRRLFDSEYRRKFKWKDPR